MKLFISFEAELQDDEIFEIDNLKKDLMDSWVKVKSGPYDNALMGYITKVHMPDNTEETRKKWKKKGSCRVL